MSFRIMMEGDDGTLWCEANHKSYDWCMANGESLCFEYEGATWWVEKEESMYEPSPQGEMYE